VRLLGRVSRDGGLFCLEGSSFADTVRHYNDFGGVVLDEQEGKNICKALGPRGKAVVLQNHGILSVGSSVDSAVAYFIRLEKLCEVQLTADAAGASTVLGQDDIASVFASYGDESEAYWQAQELFELIEAQTGGDYKL
jgi:ribulose-5-phosphate 4-epimerase/fuculose-1-phosphate aldolase